MINEIPLKTLRAIPILDEEYAEYKFCNVIILLIEFPSKMSKLTSSSHIGENKALLAEQH